MSAWVEVHVKGNRRAYIQATAVVGVIMAPGADGDSPATPESALTVVLQGGETLSDVFGLSANDLIRRCAGVREIMRLSDMTHVVCRTEPEALEAFYDTVASLKGIGRGRSS